MWDFLKPLIVRYLPVAGRYIATAAVGLLIASLNRLNIQLDAATTADLTVALAGIFVALAGWALKSTAAQAGDSKIAAAVRLASDTGATVDVTDKKTSEVHTITAASIPALPAYSQAANGKAGSR